MYQSEQINEIANALSKAQAEITPAIKDSVNPYFKSKYADLSSVWGACREPLTKNGLAILQTMEYKDNQMVLITTLTHASGQWIRSCLPILTVKQDAQSIGSAITYMRRYSLAAMVGVISDDDDGNSATYEAAPQKNVSKVESKPALQSTAITKSQAKELQEMLADCNDKFKTNFMNYLKNLVPGLDGLEKLPANEYVRIKGIIAKSRDEYSKNLNGELAHV